MFRARTRIAIGFIAPIFVCLSFAIADEDAQKKDGPPPPDVHGHIKLESGIGVTERKLQKLQLEGQTEITGHINDDTSYTVIGRARVDPYFDFGHLEGRDFPELSFVTSPLEIGDGAELELREAYIRTKAGDWNLTLGKQQVVWGVADGLRVLDVVDPIDLREFVLDDWQDSRIPLWTVNAQRAFGNWNLQLLWIPDPSYDILPRLDSDFEVTSGIPSVPKGFAEELDFQKRPSKFIDDSEVGLRLSTFQGGWDLTFNYLYYYDGIPALYRRIGVSDNGPTVFVEPEWERTQLVGGTSSKAFGSLTVRAEYGMFFDKYYSTGNYLDRDSVVKGNEFSYVIGLDWFGFKNTVVTGQLFQSYFSNDARGLSRDPLQTYVSLAYQWRFRNDTVLLEAMWLQDVNHGDGMLRPKISYAVNDHWNVYAGIDYFYGSDKGLFGEFDKKDRVVLGVKWSF